MADSSLILRCPFPSPPIPDLDLYAYITQRWTEHIDDVALIADSDGRRLTFREVNDVIARVSRDMTSSGVVQRDVISIWSGNCVEVLVVTLAAWRMGARVALVGSSLTAEEARRQLIKVHTAYLLFDSRTASKVPEALKDLIQTTLFPIGSGHQFISVQSSKPRPCPDPNIIRQPISIDLDDTALFLFSSGTTGYPKAVEISHRNLVTSMEAASGRGVGRTMSTLVLFQPISHFYGMFAAMRALSDCAPIVIMGRFDLNEYLRLISKYKASVLVVVPAVAVLMVKSPELLAKYDLSSVQVFHSSAAPIAPETIRLLTTVWPGNTATKVSQVYGMTESTGSIARQPVLPYPHPCPSGSVGLVVPYATVKIIDPLTGRACGPKTTGEIAVRGPAIMKGYAEDPEATRNAIDSEGWLHTGDIGYYEETGYLFIVDRAKELIKHKGMQVAPAELEDILLSHPGVQDAAVVGLPDELSGELPLAFVVPSPGGAKVTEAEVKEFIAGKVAPYKQLTGGVRFLPSIPRLPNGKILRRALRDSAVKAKL